MYKRSSLSKRILQKTIAKLLHRICFFKKKWDEVFKNRPGKICGRQSLKNLKGKHTIPPQIF